MVNKCQLNHDGLHVGEVLTLSCNRKIYRGAKSSIVWVHRTDWNEGSPLRTLLKDGIPPPGGDFIGFFTAISDILGEIRTTEPWLGSIWTLQEGVLLSKTALLDRHGTTLEDDRFIHNGGKASVIDLTAGLTGLVIRVAAAFMRLSNPEDAKDEDAPDAVLIEFLKQADNYVYVAGVLATIMRSGLVAYAQDSPLYVLSGKISRLSSEPEDYCWALLGALDLELANTWYNKGRDMDRVKAMFFQKLLERWQWPLFLVARVSNPVEYDVLSWPERIVDGKMLPLGIYFDVFWKNNLPALSWIDNGKDKTQPDMIILDNTKSDQACAFWKLAQPGLSRVYEQTSIVEETNAMVQIRPVGELLPAENRLYLPITDLGPQFERPGARCIEIESLDENTGRFLGVVDLWVAEEDVVQVTFADFRLLGRMV